MKSRRGVTTAQVSVIAIIVAIVAAGGTAAFFVGQPQKVQTVTEVKTQVETQVKEVTKTEVKTLRKIQFQIGWLTEDPNRHGWWVGIEKGFFREEGIDLEMITGKGGAYTTQIIVGGQALIGEGGFEPMLVAVNKGVDLVAIWAFHQNSPHAYFVKPDSGIDLVSSKFKDIVGKRVGIQRESVSFPIHRLLMSRYGVTTNQIQELPQGFDPCGLLQQNQMDVTVGFLDNAAVCRDKGIAVKAFSVADLGFAGYGTMVYVKRETLEKERELLAGFVRATNRGWKYAFDHPDEADNIFLKFFPSVKRSLAKEKGELTISLMISDDTRKHGLGWINKEKWEKQIDLLVENAIIEKKPDISRLFTNEFVDLASKK